MIFKSPSPGKIAEIRAPTVMEGRTLGRLPQAPLRSQLGATLFMPCGTGQAYGDDSYENSGKVLQNVTNASQRPLVFMLRGAAPGGMGNSRENPLLGGEKGVALRGGSPVWDNPPLR